MSSIRHAIRSIRSNPLFAIGAILTFAVGIGMNVAVFAAVDRLLLRALPYEHPERLVVMSLYRAGSAERSRAMWAPYVVRARVAPGVEDLTTFANVFPLSFRFTQSGDDAQYHDFAPMLYTGLKTLGVRPIVGTDFTEEDARLKRQRVLISYDIWCRAFGGRLDVVGQSIWVRSGERWEIAGVLPNGFFPPQIFVTGVPAGISLMPQLFDGTLPTTVFMSPILRLKPGVSLEQMQAQVDAIAAEIGPTFPTRAGVPASVVRVEPVRDVLFGRYDTYASLVFAAALTVLMIACANLASLLLVRASSREHRTAVQLALGASRRHVVQAALTEALLLALAGWVVALFILFISKDTIRLWMPPALTTYAVSVFDLHVLIFALGIATASAVAAGVIPAWRAARVDLIAVLQRGAGRSGSGRLRGSSVLLATEIALSTVLTVGAAMMGRTLVNLENVDVGFEPNGLLTVGVLFPRESDTVKLLHRYEEVLAILRQTPGVRSAAAADSLPMLGLVNRPMINGQSIDQRIPSTDGLVETLGMRIVAGRSFSADETRAMAPVAMLSLGALQLVWPGLAPHEALGRVLSLDNQPGRHVVGIVSDVRPSYMAPSVPSLYEPMGPRALNAIGVLFAVRVSPGHVVTTRDLSRQFERNGVAPQKVSIDVVADDLSAGIVNEAFRAKLFSLFGIVAIALAAIGIYAVQSFAVSLRRLEFGIRVSVGARLSDLWLLLLRDMSRPVIAGLVAGALVAYWASQFLRTFLYGIDGHDGWTFVGVAALLIAMTAAAVFAPARRASLIDSVTILRS